MQGPTDGHDDYLESLKREREARGYLPEDATFAEKVQHHVLRALAIAAAAAVFGLVWYRVNSLCGAGCERAGAIAVFLGLATLAGLFCCSLYYVLARKVVSTRVALGMHAVAAVLAWTMWIVPMRAGALADAAAKEERTAQMRQADTGVADARSKWIATLQAGDRRGPPGTFPADTVAIDDDGDTATVTNRTNQQLVVALARVRAVPDGQSSPEARWSGCGMQVDRDTRRYYWHFLSPGMQVAWRAHERCADAFRGAPLELRIGKEPTDNAPWWSDSAFEKPGGREYDGVH
jgi:hypothetical protein